MNWYSFIKLSDADARLQYIMKQFPDIKQELASDALNADPSPNKQFARFIVQWAKRGNIRLPEDGERISKALSFFSANFRRFQKRDIGQYPTFNELEATIDQLQGIDLRSRRQITQDIKVQGSREVYADKEWRVLEMTTPEAVCELGKGTKWCTTSEDTGLETAEDYLSSGPLYLFLHNNGGKWEKFAQATKDLEQIMDVMDDPVLKPPASFIAALKQMIKNGTFSEGDFYECVVAGSDYEGVDSDFVSWFKEEEKTDPTSRFPDHIYKKITWHLKCFKKRLPAVEDQIVFTTLASDRKRRDGVLDGDRMSEYMESLVIDGRWEEKEPAILASTFAMDYWLDHYNKRERGAIKEKKKEWPAYKKVILANPYRAEEAVKYHAMTVGKQRDGVLEKYLIESALKNDRRFDHCFDYASYCGFRWTELENILLKKADPIYLVMYANEVIKGRWPEAEPFILKENASAVKYASNILRTRWPQLEQNILRIGDGWNAATYAVNVLKQRWPEAEKFIYEGGWPTIIDLYEKYFGKRKASSMGWYKQAQESKNPWEMTPDDYLKSQYTGHINSTAYDSYRESKGLKDFIQYERYPDLIDTVNTNKGPVEIKSYCKEVQYVKLDENGDIVRGPDGLALFEEKKGSECGVAAFFNRMPIGFASDEFGTSGVWVVDEFQRNGLGVRLLEELHRLNPKLAKNKIGQMTNAGVNMTRAYHKRLVEKALNEGKNVSPEILKLYPDLMNRVQNKQAQKLTPQQIGLYQNFKSPTGVNLVGSGLSSIFRLPGTNQTLNGFQLMNQVISKIKGVLTKNNVHTIDTSPVSRADAIGVAISSEPGTVHVDIEKIFHRIQQQAMPSVTQLDGTEVDPDVSKGIIDKIAQLLTNELANTAAHESQHNMDYFNSFPKGRFESSESGAEGFGNQIANQYFRL